MRIRSFCAGLLAAAAAALAIPAAQAQSDFELTSGTTQIPGGGGCTSGCVTVAAGTGSSGGQTYDASDDDLTGASVASKSGVTVIGAPGFADGRGAAIVLRPGQPPQVLVGFAGDRLGESVDISPDGAAIVLGAPGLGAAPGRVILIDEDGATALPPVSAAGSTISGLGGAVSIDRMRRIVVGAPRSVVAGQTGAGEAFAFYKGTPGSPYTATGSLRPPAVPPAPDDRFGQSVDNGGGVTVIGAPGSDATQPDGGAAYIAPTPTTPNPTPPVSLPLPDVDPGDASGTDVAVSDDGEDPVVAVGVPGGDNAAGNNAGEVNVFETPDPQSPASSVATEIVVPPPGDNQSMGSSVDTDAQEILVGAPDASPPSTGVQSGSTYRIDYEPRRGGFNTQSIEKRTAVLIPVEALLELTKRIPASGDRFGSSVALGGDRYVIGSPFDDAAFAQQGTAAGFVRDAIFRAGFE